MNNHSYIIHKDTCALIPAREINYQTEVIEHNHSTKVPEPPLDIIKESCTHYWSDYEGRRNAVIQKLGYKQKTPIPLSIQRKLCFFPTHSPSHIDNCWINFNQVARLDKISKKDRLPGEQTEITFKNRYKLRLSISPHTLRTQMERAFVVMYESGMVEFEDM